MPLVDQAAAALDRLSRRENFTAPSDLVFCNETGAYLDDRDLRLASTARSSARASGTSAGGSAPALP